MEEKIIKIRNEERERQEIIGMRRKTNSSVPGNRKRRIFFVIVFVVCIVIIIAGAVFLWKDKDKKTEKQESSKDLVSQYNDQLDELKEKAQNGNSQDIQNYAIAQYATGDNQGAEQTYRKQIEKGGDSALVRNNLANALRDQKKTDEAINEYKEAINKDKNLISAYLNAGSVYQYSLQKPDSAVEIYKQGIENNSNNIDLRVFLAQAYEQMKDVENAKKIYHEILEMQSENVAAKTALQRLGE